MIGSIGLVVNPHARGSSPSLTRRLRAILDGGDELIETRTPADLERAIDQLARRGIGLLAACGGDGTNLSLLTEAVRRFGPDGLPRFATLRGGTVNTIAGNLGVRGRPDEILARIVEGRRANALPVETGQDLLEVNGRFGFLFAAAMGARFLEAYYGGPLTGPAWAAVLATRTIGSSLLQGRFAGWLFEPVPLALFADGERMPIDGARLLVASTVPSVGIGMKVAWQAGRQRGRFHLVASAMSTPQMALQLDRVLRGRPLDGAPHVDRLAERTEIHFEAPEPYTLDGELYRDRIIRIAIGPRIRVVKG